jgi:hypothetical protein
MEFLIVIDHCDTEQVTLYHFLVLHHQRFEIGVFRTLLDGVAGLFAAFTFFVFAYLFLLSPDVVFIEILPQDMLLEFAAKSLFILLAAAPPHLAGVFRPVRATRPIKVLRLNEVQPTEFTAQLFILVNQEAFRHELLCLSFQLNVLTFKLFTLCLGPLILSEQFLIPLRLKVYLLVKLIHCLDVLLNNGGTLDLKLLHCFEQVYICLLNSITVFQ